MTEQGGLEICPTCGADLVLRQDRRGRFFHGCSSFPHCKTTQPIVAERVAEGSGLPSQERPSPEDRPTDVRSGVEERLGIGGTVSCDGGEEIWSVVGLDGDSAELQIMEQPGLCRERIVPIERCRRETPTPGQDCFGYINEHWVEGRIYSDHVEDGEIRWNFLMGDEARIVPPEILRFRSADFRRDPAVALGNWIVDKPSRFELRRRFLDELDIQRRLSGGFTALLASKIEVYAHQIEVVSRVLEDPIHRFILADEVGLGKTIEAGLILRQRFLDGLARRALVLVPDHLKGQWESELQDRFGLFAPSVEIRTFSSMTAGSDFEYGAWSEDKPSKGPTSTSIPIRRTG
jgi:ssDNA-binding Zn-finger/Zn-ribbon topoisomerase 1